MITDITRSKKLYPKYLPTNKTTSINKKLIMRYVSFDIFEIVFYNFSVVPSLIKSPGVLKLDQKPFNKLFSSIL